MKKINFLSSLPRSGSTLLSVLLSQHPDVFCSHQSALLTSMNDYKLSIPHQEPVMLDLTTKNHMAIYYDMAQSYYKVEEKPFIIDNNRKWGAPFSLDIAKDISDNVKIIYVYRPILEVLASFIRIANKNPGTNFIDVGIKQQDFLQQYYRPIDDTRCDWLMRANGLIDSSLLSLGVALQKEYKHMFHIVSYDDIVNNTQNTLSSIYKFIGVDDYIHNLSSIEEYHNPLDESVLGAPDLHKVRPKIKRVSPPPEEVLSEYVIQKYGNATLSMGMKK